MNKRIKKKRNLKNHNTDFIVRAYIEGVRDPLSDNISHYNGLVKTPTNRCKCMIACSDRLSKILQ